MPSATENVIAGLLDVYGMTMFEKKRNVERPRFVIRIEVFRKHSSAKHNATRSSNAKACLELLNFQLCVAFETEDRHCGVFCAFNCRLVFYLWINPRESSKRRSQSHAVRDISVTLTGRAGHKVMIETARFDVSKPLVSMHYVPTKYKPPAHHITPPPSPLKQRGSGRRSTRLVLRSSKRRRVLARHSPSSTVSTGLVTVSLDRKGP